MGETKGRRGAGQMRVRKIREEALEEARRRLKGQQMEERGNRRQVWREKAS